MTLRLNRTDRRVLEAFTAKNGVSNIPMARIWLKEERKFTISDRTLYNSVSKLVAMQYLRLMPGDKSPALYEPGGIYYKEKERASAKTIAINAVVAKNNTPLPFGSSAPIYPAPFHIDGVVVAKECPDGYGAAHLNGSMSLTVVTEGTFEDLRIGNLNVGRWNTEYLTKGAVNRAGEIDIDGQRITFNFRKGTRTGNLNFSLKPARIFIDPAKFQTRDQIVAVFQRRAMKVSSLLAKHGWVLKDPVFNGNTKIELAFPNSPLVNILSQGPADQDAILFADGSHGNPEAEMVISEDGDLEKAAMVANFPIHILEAKRNAAEAKEGSDRAQTTCAEAHRRIDDLIHLVDRILDVQGRTSQAVLNNAENIAKLVHADSELTALFLSQQTRSVYAPVENIGGRVRKLEGYQ